MRIIGGLYIFFLFLLFSCNDNPTAQNSVSNEVNPPPASNSLSNNSDAKEQTEDLKVLNPESGQEDTVLEAIPKASTKEVSDVKKQPEAAKQQQKKIKPENRKKPEIEFKETVFDFGVINQGDKIEHDFVFKNTGNADLEILNVDVSCGCTVPTFPFMPIAPGEEGKIGVIYNSTGKLGNQKPMITVVANTRPARHKIYLKGVVDAERSGE